MRREVVARVDVYPHPSDSGSSGSPGLKGAIHFLFSNVWHVQPDGSSHSASVVVFCFSLRWPLWHFRRPGRFSGPGHVLPGERRPAGRVRRPVGPQRCTDGECEGVGDAVHGWETQTRARRVHMLTRVKQEKHNGATFSPFYLKQLRLIRACTALFCMIHLIRLISLKNAI